MKSSLLFAFVFFTPILLAETTLSAWVKDHGVRMEFDGVLEQAHLFKGEQTVLLDFWGRWAHGPGNTLRVLDFERTDGGDYLLSQDMAFWLEDQFGDRQGSRVGVIIIDPGHGGRDPGALGKIKVGDRTITLTEKSITLKVGTLLAEALQERYPEKRIILTRTGDTYPSLDDRVELAHAQDLGPRETILFLSLHVNASFNTRAQGFEIWHIPRDYNRDLVEEEYLEESQRSLLPILNDLIDREYKTESIRLAQILSSTWRIVSAGSQSKPGSERRSLVCGPQSQRCPLFWLKWVLSPTPRKVPPLQKRLLDATHGGPL
jgi:N-acetylmuramoyl-L-alanine amidase